jgi:nucleoside-diphosphate-sugar epimerase
VTGGAGYIGAILVPQLLGRGHHAIVLDNFMYGQTPLLDWVSDPKLEVVRGDARDASLLRSLVPRADILIPLACLTGAPRCERDPIGAQSVTIDAIETLLEIRSPAQAIIYPTTNSGYGIGQEGIHCSEENPLRPISLYGRLKVEAERRILEARSSVTLRLATAFGMSPRMRLDLLVNDFTYRAVTDRFLVLFEAAFRRNFIHVRDIARAFLHAIDHFEEMAGGPFNVGLDDANLSKWELCEAIRKHVPEFFWTEAPIGEDPDKRNYVVSNEKIRKTGFTPDFSLDRGIRELVSGYQILRRSEFSNV